MLPAGPLARKFGPVIILFIGIGTCSFLVLATPLLTHELGWKAVCIIRALQGFSQGMTFPCTHTLLAKWSPVSERSRLSTICYSGGSLGHVFILSISGVIISSPLGWEGVFYLTGVLSLVWSGFFYFLGSNSPDENKHISKIEKEYINSSCCGSDIIPEPTCIPWKSIFTSIPFLALIIVHTAQAWGYWVILTYLPTYMNNVLKYDIKSNAVLSSLPYLMTWIMGIVFSVISDHVNNKKLISIEKSRKIFNSIGMWIPMILIIGVGFITEEYKIFAVVILTMACALNGAIFVGFLVSVCYNFYIYKICSN